ncbi:MAG TPA: tyrosine-type recombinase/integrase [Gaiellaceae bacterium]
MPLRSSRGEPPFAPIGLHEARHTYASLMIAAGVNAKALATYLGHSSITITLDRYGHLMPGNGGGGGGASRCLSVQGSTKRLTQRAMGVDATSRRAVALTLPHRHAGAALRACSMLAPIEHGVNALRLLT